jgi:hypothetical protein
MGIIVCVYIVCVCVCVNLVNDLIFILYIDSR